MSGECILVTGGAGFIGSAVVRAIVAGGRRVVNVDKLTYAGDLGTVAALADDPAHIFERIDICDGPALAAAFARHRPDAVIHLAAESHVDRSIDDAAAFIQTNLIGTYRLLEVALDHWRGLDGAARAQFRFLHVSTDEVFGALGPAGAFDEDSPHRPNSPYAASKAGADHLVRAWGHTHGLPVLIGNCGNNYGPFQFPEKLIPLILGKALKGQPLPIYGEGANVRDWLYVEDHARALLAILADGRVQHRYGVGARAERRNLDLVRMVCAILDDLRPDPAGPHARLIRFVEDRPGHDFRYAIDPSKLENELGWRARESLETGLRRTVAWYLDNADWYARIAAERYDGRRLGGAARGRAQ